LDYLSDLNNFIDQRIRFISIGLAVIGLLDSLYLAIVKFTNSYALCGPLGDCESVNSSSYSEIAGIPIAVLGAGSYSLMIILLLLERQNRFWQEYSPMLVFGLCLVGVLYSIYLTYVEIAILEAICPYCVLSAIILVVLLVLSSIRLWRGFSG
jgi:uncharacterized membrane protein